MTPKEYQEKRQRLQKHLDQLTEQVRHAKVRDKRVATVQFDKGK